MHKLAIRGGAPSKTKSFPEWPIHDEKDEENLLKALKSGRWGKGATGNLIKSSEDKSFIQTFEETMANRIGVQHALAVSNGTSALDIAIRALGISQGDEVIVTPYSYIASATCILQSGAIPVFADVELETWNVNPESIKKLISNRTKAIIVVHFAGQSANMDEIMTIARENSLAVIEDVAHGYGGSWNGKALGTFGDLGCYSFQESKNLTCGEGGLIVTNSQENFEKIYSYHMTGRLYKGKWYEHYNLGWNARITEFQAAIACSQLEKFNEQNNLRKNNAEILRTELSKIEGIVVTQVIDQVTDHPYHIFTLRYDASKWNNLSRNRFIRALNCEGIPCHIGYLYPIYKNPLFLSIPELLNATNEMLCPNAERICNEAIWIPQHILLGDTQDMMEIVDAFHKIKLNLVELGV